MRGMKVQMVGYDGWGVYLAKVWETNEVVRVRNVVWEKSRGHWVDEVTNMEEQSKISGQQQVVVGPTPWWNQVRRCIEGDYTPVRTEGWNHPTAGE